MRLLRLRDPLLSVLFENDDIIAVDKPYGFNTHTNESKTGNENLTEDGLIEIFEKQLGQKLHIVHRLDQTTTGVIIFAKTPEGQKKYADYFFNRQVKKTYWFITANTEVRAPFEIDEPILQKAKELEASTRFTHLKKSKRYSLWQANPFTGRNHQIRLHAKAAGLSLLGDPKYGGEAFAFLCLHNHRIEFPELVIESKAPAHFHDLELLENPALATALFEADRRTRIFGKATPTDAFRLAHRLDLGYSIDRLGDFLHINGEFKEAGKLIATAPPESWSVQESGMNFEVRKGQGLFTDQRLQRLWVRENSEGKTVLNLFAYTCAFSVAAALGGATKVTSVDSSKNALNWGRRNFELNGLDAFPAVFLLRDAPAFVEKKTKFDLIICDPPAFSRGEKGVFKLENSLEALLKNCFGSLNENGQLLFSTQHEGFFIDDIRRLLQRLKPKAQLTNILPALDFELPQQRPQLISFLIQT